MRFFTKDTQGTELSRSTVGRQYQSSNSGNSMFHVDARNGAEASDVIEDRPLLHSVQNWTLLLRYDYKILLGFVKSRRRYPLHKELNFKGA